MIVPLIDWLISYLIHWISSWLIDWLACWLIDGLLIDRSACWLIDWLIDWSACWLIDLFIYWLTVFLSIWFLLWTVLVPLLLLSTSIRLRLAYSVALARKVGVLLMPGGGGCTGQSGVNTVNIVIVWISEMKPTNVISLN